MSSLLPAKMEAQLPVYLRKGVGKAVSNELKGGVASSFPIISYRGKVWRVRKGGEEVNYVDAEGEAVPSIELVLVKANPQPSKTYYAKKYEEGSSEPPACWSSDGVKPDAAVPNKQSALCASCPRNKWGSRITEAGKKGRECADVRRMAVVFAHELESKGVDCHKFLLRIPPASLNPLKEYAEKVLDPKGVEYFAVVTRVGFNPQSSHPQLTFKAVRWLTEEEYEAINEVRDSDEVSTILLESEFDAGAGTTGGEEAAERHPQNEAPAPAPAPAPAKAVEAEEVETEDEDDEDDEDEDELPPPPPPPPADKPKKKTKKSTTPTEAAPAAPSTPPKASGGFEDLLDSILK